MLIPYIRLLIITMTERIMHSEKHAEYIKQTRKRTTTDTGNECQYTLFIQHVQ